MVSVFFDIGRPVVCESGLRRRDFRERCGEKFCMLSVFVLKACNRAVLVVELLQGGTC